MSSCKTYSFCWLRPTAGGPRPKGTEDSGTPFGTTCNPSQPAQPSQPASPFCGPPDMQIRCSLPGRTRFPGHGPPVSQPARPASPAGQPRQPPTRPRGIGVPGAPRMGSLLFGTWRPLVSCPRLTSGRLHRHAAGYNGTAPRCLP